MDKHQVVVVRYGTRVTTRSDVYLNFPLYNQVDSAISMDYFFWVVRGENETVLVDTGFSRRAGEARGRTVVLDPAEAFERAGVAVESPLRIILTHGHYDHIGNVGLFPNAELIMSRKEFDFWAGPHSDKPLFAHSVEKDELVVLREAADRGRITFFENEMTVAPGIRVVEVGGHTPGQSIVFVDTSEGTVLLASDAVHYYEECEQDMLFTSVSDLVEMYDAFARIRSMQKAGEITALVPGHDPSTLERFPPADGPLEGYGAVIGTSPAPQGGMRDDQTI